LEDCDHNTASSIADKINDPEVIALIKEKSETSGSSTNNNLSFDSLLKSLEEY